MHLCERKKSLIWHFDVKGTGWVGLLLSVILMQTVGRFNMSGYLGIQNIQCLTQKLNRVFNDDKYYCLFFIYTKQPSPCSYMIVRKTIHIALLNEQQGSF